MKRSGLSLLLTAVLLCTMVTGAFAADVTERAIPDPNDPDTPIGFITIQMSSNPDVPVIVSNMVAHYLEEGLTTLHVSTPNEVLADEDVVRTGTIFLLEDSTGKQGYSIIVVRSDATGSGRMGLTQVVRLAEAYTGKNPLVEPYLLGGDLNGNGKIDLTDLSMMLELIKASEERVDASMWADQESMTNYLLTHRFRDDTGGLLTFALDEEDPTCVDGYINGELDRPWAWVQSWGTYGSYFGEEHVPIEIHADGTITYGPADNHFVRIPSAPEPSSTPTPEQVDPSMWADEASMTAYLVNHTFMNEGGDLLTFTRVQDGIDAYINGEYDRTWPYKDSWCMFSTYFAGEGRKGIYMRNDGHLMYGLDDNYFYRVEDPASPRLPEIPEIKQEDILQAILLTSRIEKTYPFEAGQDRGDLFRNLVHSLELIYWGQRGVEYSGPPEFAYSTSSDFNEYIMDAVNSRKEIVLDGKTYGCYDTDKVNRLCVTLFGKDFKCNVPAQMLDSRADGYYLTWSDEPNPDYPDWPYYGCFVGLILREASYCFEASYLYDIRLDQMTGGDWGDGPAWDTDMNYNESVYIEPNVDSPLGFIIKRIQAGMVSG